MKFVHVGGDIAYVDGYTFMFRNTVDVTNRATIEKLLNSQNFRRQEVEEKEQENEKISDKKQCSKCGKIFSKGLYMHEKYCKGK